MKQNAFIARRKPLKFINLNIEWGEVGEEEGGRDWAEGNG